MRVKKYIEIPEEILVGLVEGKFVKGSLHRDKTTGRIVFNAYNRKPKKRRREETIGHTDFGRVGKTFRRYHWYENLPTELDADHLAVIMERDCQRAKSIIAFDQLMDQV